MARRCPRDASKIWRRTVDVGPVSEVMALQRYAMAMWAARLTKAGHSVIRLLY